MHETRRGEMAALKEVPFGLYYGGVDTTPLFVALAGAYCRRTGDLALIGALWPALQRAPSAGSRAYGDSNGDGLIDYARGADTGLANQGWKDSEDSVFHADGRFPVGPIALVEVQGYAFAAFRAMAELAERLRRAAAPSAGAPAPRRCAGGSEQRFWMEDEGFYGIAIDGDGAALHAADLQRRPSAVHRPAQSPERAARVTQRLLSADFDSGWGLRTLAAGEARFNPMTYHNGSVWPHDTAICVAGMARYGERRGVARVMGDLFEAARLLRTAPAGAVLRLRRARPASRRSPIRSPACRRPGRRARCS